MAKGGKVKDFSEETQELLRSFGFQDEDDIIEGFNSYLQKEYGYDVQSLLNSLVSEGEMNNESVIQK